MIVTRKTKPDNETVDAGAGRWRPGRADGARILAAVAVATGALYIGYLAIAWILDGSGGEIMSGLAALFVGLFFLSGALLAFAVVARPTLNARHEAVGEHVTNKESTINATGETGPFMRVSRQLAALLASGLVLLIGIGVIDALLEENSSGKAAAVAVAIGTLSIIGVLFLYRWIRGPRPTATDAAPRAPTMPVPIRILRWLLYAVAATFAVGGLVGGIVGVDAGLSSDNDDDVWAAVFLGACGLFLGAAVFVVLRISARRWSREPVDVDGVTAVGLAQMHGAADMGAGGYDGGE